MRKKEKHPGGAITTYKRVFDAYYEAIKNYLYYKCGDVDLAEDLSQEVFLKLWERREQIQEKKVKSYLYTIATNLFLNQIKHQKVVLKFQSQALSSVSNQTPQFLMEEREFQARLEASLASLPEKNRTVFLMNRIDKLTYREIAERLEISEKAVEKRMTRALKVLRQLNEKI
jgi:RNA polymerase sigma-70 factor (family 1)